MNQFRTPAVSWTDGYNYRLESTIVYQTCIFPYEEFKSGGIILTTCGKLIILGGYSSDGPSGPTIDTTTFMFGAFVHDGLYEILRCSQMPLHHQCNIVQPDSLRLGEEAEIYRIPSEHKPVIIAASHEQVREEADRTLVDLVLQDGMMRFRANYVFKGVRVGGLNSARDRRKLYSAPAKKHRIIIPFAPEE